MSSKAWKWIALAVFLTVIGVIHQNAIEIFHCAHGIALTVKGLYFLALLIHDP